METALIKAALNNLAVQVCDARNDAMKTKAGIKKKNKIHLQQTIYLWLTGL